MSLKRQRAIYALPDDQALIREQAAKHGKTISGYLLDLAIDDDPDIHPLHLSAAEQQEILDGIRALDQLSRSLRRELPDVEGLNLFGIDALAKSLP